MLISACRSPQDTVNPNDSSSNLPNPGQANVVKSSPVVQITEYTISENGEKTVMLNGKELRVSWRLRRNYDYDAQKRLTLQKTTVWNNSSWWESLSYQYTPDLAERYQNWENKDFVNVLFLNEKGYIKGNLEPNEYIYNNEGFLTTYQGNNQRDTYIVKDGNVVAKETVYNSGGVQSNTYEYNLDKPNILSPLTFRGKPSQNLLSRQTLVSTNIGSSTKQTTVFTHYYNFDQQGRPAWEIVVADSESTPRSIREFIYQ